MRRRNRRRNRRECESHGLLICAIFAASPHISNNQGASRNLCQMQHREIFLVDDTKNEANTFCIRGAFCEMCRNIDQLLYCA
jgi:hypothetical protein